MEPDKQPHPIVINTGDDNGAAPPEQDTPAQAPAQTKAPTDPAPAPGQWVELAAVQQLLDDLSRKQAIMVGIATAAAMLALIVAFRAQSTAKDALHATRAPGG